MLTMACNSLSDGRSSEYAHSDGSSSEHAHSDGSSSDHADVVDATWAHCGDTESLFTGHWCDMSMRTPSLVLAQHSPQPGRTTIRSLLHGGAREKEEEEKEEACSMSIEAAEARQEGEKQAEDKEMRRRRRHRRRSMDRASGPIGPCLRTQRQRWLLPAQRFLAHTTHARSPMPQLHQPYRHALLSLESVWIRPLVPHPWLQPLCKAQCPRALQTAVAHHRNRVQGSPSSTARRSYSGPAWAHWLPK